MPQGQGQIIGSATTDSPYVMYINNSGAVPVAGYSGGEVYPLLVTAGGRLMTDAQFGGSLVIGSVSANVDAIYVQSGANIDLGSAWQTVGSVWLAHDDTTPVPISGEVSTSITSADVYITSGADIGSVYLKDGAYVSIIPSGTFYSSVSASGTNGMPISGVVSVENLATAGSLAIQDIAGSVAISTSPISVSGVLTVDQSSTTRAVTQSTDPWIILGSTNINNFNDLGSKVVIDNPSTVGSLAIQTVDATDLDIRDLTSASDSVSAVQSGDWDINDISKGIQTNDVKVIGSVYQLTSPWEVTGSVNIDNASSVGSVGTQNVTGSLAVSTDPVPVSGIVNTQLYTGSEAYGHDFGDRYIQRIDYQGGNNPVYLGFAEPGTSTSSAGWQLRKLSYSGGLVTAILFGSGNTNFDKIWDNRSGTNEVYS